MSWADLIPVYTLVILRFYGQEIENVWQEQSCLLQQDNDMKLFAGEEQSSRRSKPDPPLSGQSTPRARSSRGGKKWGEGGGVGLSNADLRAPRSKQARQPTTYLDVEYIFNMNPSLANFILKKTPDFVLHPTTMSDTEFTLNTGAKIPALGMFICRDELC